MAITKALSVFILALCAMQTLAIDFTASKWIWTNELDSAGNATPGSRAFRRVFTSSANKTALAANILINADDLFTLYVNGAVVGTGTDYRTASAFCVPLAASTNVFAVNATNLGPARNSAGLLLAVQITYTDGSTQTMVTDSSWRSSVTFTTGFEQLGFDDSAWPAATVEGSFPSKAPWGSITSPPPTSSIAPALCAANWVWTNEVSQGNAPVGSRAFRKVFTLPPGQLATSATIFISVDNEYTLYVQGQLVGSSTDWTSAHSYVVNLVPGFQVTIGVLAKNDDGPAALIAAVEIRSAACPLCPSLKSAVTDGTWKFSTSTPVGFQAPGFDDSTWQNVVVEGKYGVGPWGNIPMAS
ncbi:hypothetical protein GALMADRAFT_232132 [Galerina marginata CBS 339.88]|uniref:Uncharacterized protein n=1 Tax=Galerina marginata (strain CBS 339.88) TaxID=685588 RepID=A0A067SKH9_GALM3|nr:hypothetical protein GALMADRAFT_232132 [Galerina marginata CBS 339.88]